MKESRKSVQDYLVELERTKAGRTEQVREGLETYIELWRKALEKGVVEAGDDVETALEKIEQKGGLYKAAE